MITAQYRLLTEGLGIKHLRLVLGNSMAGHGDEGLGRMNSWASAALGHVRT